MNNKQSKFLYWILLIFVSLFLFTDLLYAQSGSDEPATGTKISFWQTIAAGGFIGIVIMIISLVSLALIVENFVNLKREKLVPTDLVSDLTEHFQKKEYEKAAAVCQEDESFLGDVVAAGLGNRDSAFGFFEMQNAMQEVSERQISRMYRKLEYLSFIGAVSPILGLLGTVTGMIRAFNQIALTEGMTKPSQLAGGISEALVTTCMGLIVAIPAMFFVTFFRNRIDSFIAEAETVIEKLMTPLRKSNT